jgi:choline dehydrogenase
MTSDTFDYIVVGAGSAGAALAARLAEGGDGRVLLLEAGEARHEDFWVRVPIGVAKLLTNPRYVWQFQTEAQATLIGQQIYWPRGRMPGGSSSVNGMIFVRGDPREFDHWAALGNDGWSHADLLPYFRRMEHTALGDDAMRGRSGATSVTSLRDAFENPLSDSFLQACQQAGIPKTDDYNGERYEGVSYLQLSTEGGQRCSTAKAYLATPRSNLKLVTGALVIGIEMDGLRATGVRYRVGNTTRSASARREVALAAGPIKSPQLLELSGIGDAERLQALGIPVRQHLPGVGENLIDHLQSRLTFECKEPITLNDIMSSPLRQAWMGMRYLINRRGPMATPSASVHALARTRASEDRPDVKIQLHHISGADRYAKKGYGLDPFPGFGIGFFQLRPRSRGSVHATSTDPGAAPRIDPRYLDHEEDRDTTLRALRLARVISRQSAFGRHLKRETRPGIGIDDDEGLLDYIKASGQTSWHPVGTCRMGPDAQAVVDCALRVHGIERLRVVDSSVMPTMCSSNTNAASIVIGEKGADLMLEAWRIR